MSKENFFAMCKAGLKIKDVLTPQDFLEVLLHTIP